ncbi:MAG: ATP-binding protein [Desulfobacterales bacterium]|nr:ATP-binding protein [Desulfobacterales bacterium]
MSPDQNDSRSAFPQQAPTLLGVVLDALPISIAIVDAEGRLAALNSAWRQLTHQFTGHDVKVGDTAMLLAENDPESMSARMNPKQVAELNRIIDSGREHFACDFTDTRNNKEYWYRVDARRLDRPPWKAILTVSDITSRKRAELALRSSQDQLYQAQKMEALGTLVAGMAHEINNPTSLILFNLPIVERVWRDILPHLQLFSQQGRPAEFGGYKLDYLESHFQQLILDMELAANRISKIVKDLKNFSRRSQIHEKAPVDINAAVTAALRLAQTTMRKSDVELTLNLSENLPRINGNRTAIEQVALNVVINAIQAIEHERGHIIVETGYVHDEDRVFIAVHDNGRGINPEVADKLFDPFVTDNQGRGGTGLGLAVSYNLVQAHEGQITFDDSDQGGTVFTITLPVETKQKLPHVLVVDDDAPVRRLIVQAVSKTGLYAVDEAANGVDGLIKIGSRPPDLLILDLMMPGMNGLEVCQAIHGKEPFAAMKVLITTGHPHHPDLEKIAALGFTQIHSKPINITAFRAAIAAIMA